MSDVTLMTLMTMMMMVTENITDTTNNCIALLYFAVFLCRQIVRTNVIQCTLDRYDAQINKIIDQLNTQRTTTDRYRKIDTCFAFRDQMNQ